MKIVDYSAVNSGLNNYAVLLYENLKSEFNASYENHYAKRYYINAVINRLSRLSSKIENDTAIFTNFLAIRNKYKREFIVIHDSFLWKYGSNIEKFLFFTLNITLNGEFIYNSYYTKSKYDNDKGTVIYPFIYKKFYTDINIRPFLNSYILTDYNIYPNKNVELYNQIYKNDNHEFLHIGSCIQGVKSLTGLSLEDVYNTYINARALLFLSKEEGFGYPLAQAGLLGIPIIMLDNEINREIYGYSKYYYNDVIGDNYKINREIFADMTMDIDFLNKKKKELREKFNPINQLNQWKLLLK